MLKQLSLALFLTLLISSHAHSQGRAPAVEPEVGISIDEYEQVHAGPEKGFDFTQANPGVSADLSKRSKNLTGQSTWTARDGSRAPNSYTTKERAPSPIWTLLALTALPFGLWLLLRQTFPKEIAPSHAAHPEGSEGVTIDLASEREKRKSFEEDEDKKVG